VRDGRLTEGLGFWIPAFAGMTASFDVGIVTESSVYRQ